MSIKFEIVDRTINDLSAVTLIDNLGYRFFGVCFFFLSFSFGVAENAEAGMTVHSQS